MHDLNLFFLKVMFRQEMNVLSIWNTKMEACQKQMGSRRLYVSYIQLHIHLNYCMRTFKLYFS